MTMSPQEFYQKAVPEFIREREKKKNIFLVWNRAIAWREAYFLHNLGVTGNMVSLFRIFLGLLSLFLFSALRFGDITKPLLGVMLMAWQINLDGVDGALARAQDKTSDFGTALDNLGIDYVRTGLFILIAYMSDNMYLGILSLFVSYVLVTFRQYVLGVDVSIFMDWLASKLIYVPIFLVLLPLLMIGTVYSGISPQTVCKAVSLFYIGFTALWFEVILNKRLRESP